MTNDFGGPWYINHFDEITPEPGVHRGTTDGDVVAILGMQAFQVAPGGAWVGHTLDAVRKVTSSGPLKPGQTAP